MPVLTGEGRVSLDSAGFHIEITPKGAGYKSIKSLAWENIPDFAIVTGRNGSGKTQLLEILLYHITGTFPPQMNSLGVIVSIEGADFDADEVGFVPSSGRFSGGGASASQMQQMRQQMLQQSDNINSYRNDPAQMSRSRRIQKMINGRHWQSETNYGQSSLEDDEFSALLVDVDVAASLAIIFVVHRIKMVEALERGTPGFTKDGKPIGPAPWDVVNDALKVAGFPYEVISPTEVGLLDHYELRLRDKESNIIIRPMELSSGEQVLLQLTLWLFSSGKDGVFPKLLLLDEPDAHLHPSMTVQFIDVVSEVLVRKHGIKVIMTTHSPSTVALAPEGAVFQMERGSAQIIPVRDRPEIISILTAGLVTVSPATRFCFVEDEDDVQFYSAILDILKDGGPSKDSMSIKSSPSLAFIAASVGRGSDKISGGNSIVRKWVDKLDSPPLTHTFLGIVDRDTGNVSSGRVKVIGRYSFENYLLDPVNVFGLLLENGSGPKVDGVVVTSGDEHLIRDFSNEYLQKISDVISAKVELENPSLIKLPRTTVSYTNGRQVEVGRWVVNHRGHDLLPMLQKAWGGHQLINPPRLIKVLRRVRLIPRELATLFAELQL